MTWVKPKNELPTSLNLVVLKRLPQKVCSITYTVVETSSLARRYHVFSDTYYLVKHIRYMQSVSTNISRKSSSEVANTLVPPTGVVLVLPHPSLGAAGARIISTSSPKSDGDRGAIVIVSTWQSTGASAPSPTVTQCSSSELVCAASQNFSNPGLSRFLATNAGPASRVNRVL